ncbi:MAG: PLDc N-terminal domain-containing protein [Bryobacterales bacterium]|nr:PLDc N-terminal domain-containing protein [Bryobacterales bacterium]
MPNHLLRSLTVGVFAATPIFAQDPSVEDAIAAGGCLACGGTMVLIPIIFLAINIALLIWVARDSKARGMENPILWVLLVLLLSVIGVVIYLINRPKAELRDCPSCGKKRMEGLLRCPHCGNP